MNRGVIVGLGNKHLIVLSEGNFVRVPARPGVTAGDEISFGTEEIERTKKRPWYVPHACLAGLAAVAVMFSFLLPSLQPANLDYAIAVVDINPSIELVLNQESEVTGFSALNEDGAELGNLELVGLEIGEAIETIIQGAEAKGFVDYLDETNVLVTTVPLVGNEEADKKIKKEILDDLADSAILKSVNLAIADLSEKEYRSAREENRPAGLMALPNNQDLQYGTVHEYFDEPANVILFEEKGALIHSENQALWHIVDGLEQLAEDQDLELDLVEMRDCLRSGKSELSEILTKAEELLEETKETTKEKQVASAKVRDEQLKQATKKLENNEEKEGSDNNKPGNKKDDESELSAGAIGIEIDDTEDGDDPDEDNQEVSEEMEIEDEMEETDELDQDSEDMEDEVESDEEADELDQDGLDSDGDSDQDSEDLEDEDEPDEEADEDEQEGSGEEEPEEEEEETDED